LPDVEPIHAAMAKAGWFADEPLACHLLVQQTAALRNPGRGHSTWYGARDYPDTRPNLPSRWGSRLSCSANRGWRNVADVRYEACHSWYDGTSAVDGNI